MRLLLLFLLSGVVLAGGPARRSKRIDDAVEKVQPAVVKIFGVKGFRGLIVVVSFQHFGNRPAGTVTTSFCASTRV